MLRRLAALVLAPLALSLAIFGTVTAQPDNPGAAAGATIFTPVPPGPTLAQAGPVAAPLFAARCAGCHEPASGRAPDRAQLAARTPEAILDALTEGSMKGFSQGLEPQQIRSLAVFAANKPFSLPNARIADNMCAANPPIAMTPSSWNGWGNGLPGHRAQPNPGLAAAVIPKLKVKWAFAYPGSAYGQPTVIGDHLFISSSGGAIYSLDAKTGCVHWRHDSPVGARTTLIVEHRPGASPSGWLAYYGDTRGTGPDGVGRYYALDAMTGAVVWTLEIDRHPYLRFTGSPVIYKDRLYIPISSLEEGGGTTATGCCTFTGAIAAVDLKTHTIAWKTRVMETPHPTRKNAQGGQMFGPAGGAIWMSPTIDAKRNMLYLGTGDSYSELESGRADAIEAFDLGSGKIKWATQVTQGDNYMSGCPRGVSCPLGQPGPDYDFGASPVLVHLPDGKDLVTIGQKSSFVYAVDPDDGHMVWKKPMGAGSALGGVEWGMATDGRLLFVSNSDALAGARGQTGLTALNPANGEIAWRFTPPKLPCHFVTSQTCRNLQSAAPSVIPGYVFAGSTDGRIRALQARDGKVVWEFDTTGQTYDTVNGVKGQPGGNIDVAGPVIAGGMVYTMSGYVGPATSGGNAVNVLLAFSVDGK